MQKKTSFHIVKVLTIIILLFVSDKIYSQNQMYYVKQTQKSMNLQTYEPTKDFFTSIIFKEKGIQFNIINGKHFIQQWNEINKVTNEDGTYRYQSKIEDYNIALFFMKTTHNSNIPELAFGIVGIPGIEQNDPNIITYIRFVFIEGLIIDNSGNLIKK